MIRLSALLTLLLSAVLFGCGSARPREESLSSQPTSLFPHTLRLRRPSFAPARANAQPDDPDFKTRLESPGAEKMAARECLKPAQALSEIPLATARECLRSMQAPGELRWRLKRDAQPYWELEDAKNAPECARATLDRLPVSREIVFQSGSHEHLECYAASLDLEADRVARVRLPLNRIELVVKLPLDPLPTSDEQMRWLMTTWAITPFWQGQGAARAIPARAIPLEHCEACIGSRELVRDWEGAPASWP